MRTSRKRTRITLLVILLLFISMGYAFVSTGLKIDGIATIFKQTWDVHFENVKVKRGSVTPIHEATINVEDTTQVSYEVHLENPGDFYEFEVDVVNNGTIDAMVTEILSTNNNQPISLPSYMKYSVTYEDGSEIKPNHLLKKKEEGVPTRERYKVGVYFKSDIDPSELVNSQPLNLRLKFEVTYGQATKDAYERDVTMFLTGKEVNVKMKELAGDDTTSGSTTVNTSVTSIKRSVTEPAAANKTANNKVSTDDSRYPIYIWYDNGTIYWWSEVTNPYLNSDSSAMFRNFSNLTDISGLADLTTSKVEDIQVIFANDLSLADISAVSNWNTSKVTNMTASFQKCIVLTNLGPLSGWNTSKVENMTGTFIGHNGANMTISDLSPISGWDTSNVKSMRGMFQMNANLTDLDDIASWNTPKLENMYGMFTYSENLTDATALKDWNLSNVTTVDGIFSHCTSLVTADVTRFNPSKLVTTSGMFDNCSSLTTIYGNASFNVNNITDSTDMFNKCTSLVGGGPTPFDSAHTDKEYARVGTSTTPGYFTLRNN